MKASLRSLPAPLKAALPAIIILAALSWLRRDSPPTIVNRDGIGYERDTNLGITVALFHRPLELCTAWNNPPALDDLAASQKFAIAINGSYFTGSYLHAGPAGLMRRSGTSEGGLLNDRQLSHVVIYARQYNRLTFVAAEAYRPDQSQSLAIQSGPLILMHGSVQRESIASSKNGRGGFRRTILGQTDKSELFFAITTKSYNLVDLADALNHMEIFRGRQLDAINLDGGPSTALFTNAGQNLCFNEEKRLPIVLGVRSK